MSNIFESYAIPPNPMLVEAELNYLKTEIISDNLKVVRESDNSFAVAVPFDNVDELKRFCANESIGVVLGATFPTLEDKFLATVFLMEITGERNKDARQYFELTKSLYYKMMNEGFNESRQEILDRLNKVYLKLYKYFTVTIHIKNHHPRIVTLTSKL